MTAKNNQSEALLECIVRAGDDRLASDIVALNVQELSALADYFVIMTAQNERQLQAVADAITEAVEKAGFALKNEEGKGEGHWVLLDCYDVIVHLFLAKERETYQLEKLWHEAPLVNVNPWLS